MCKWAITGPHSTGRLLALPQILDLAENNWPWTNTLPYSTFMNEEKSLMILLTTGYKVNMIVLQFGKI
jgi:hypothetical protein